VNISATVTFMSFMIGIRKRGLQYRDFSYQGCSNQHVVLMICTDIREGIGRYRSLKNYYYQLLEGDTQGFKDGVEIGITKI